MTRPTLSALVLVGLFLAWPATAHAQFVVFDPAVFGQAVNEVLNTLRQYTLLVQQARRLPVDMANRYRALSPAWPTHDLTGWLFAQPILTALNSGDTTGARYRQVTDLVDVPNDVLARMPAELRRRLGTAYATIELADSIATRAVDQAGLDRANGRQILQTIQSMDADAFSVDDSYQTQTAILNKINTASVLGLRIGAQSNQFLMDALEQMLVENKRRRDTEAKAMDATIHQWRYGQAYGADLFSRTAVNLDTWRPY
jgi:hypothetical protein